MESTKVIIELYSDMPSNEFEDFKSAGDFIMLSARRAIPLIDVLINTQVEFTVYEVGKCLIDKSYEYWA